jgi:hypothetical protein
MKDSLFNSISLNEMIFKILIVWMPEGEEKERNHFPKTGANFTMKGKNQF